VTAPANERRMHQLPSRGYSRPRAVACPKAWFGVNPERSSVPRSSCGCCSKPLSRSDVARACHRDCPNAVASRDGLSGHRIYDRTALYLAPRAARSQLHGNAAAGRHRAARDSLLELVCGDLQRRRCQLDRNASAAAAAGVGGRRDCRRNRSGRRRNRRRIFPLRPPHHNRGTRPVSFDCPRRRPTPEAAVSNTIWRQARLPSDRSLRGARADVPLGGVARALHCRQFSKRAERGQ